MTKIKYSKALQSQTRVTKNYSPILALILIQIAYAVHTHTQFNMIGKQSYANDCSS